MEIEISNLTKQKINLNKLYKLSFFVCQELSLKGNVSIVLVAKKRIRSLNRKWRKKDKPTDVLCFNYPILKNKDKNIVNAEIFINLDDCKKTNNYKVFFSHKPEEKDVLLWLLIHAILHLKGLDDNSDKKRDEIISFGKKIFEKIMKK